MVGGDRCIPILIVSSADDDDFELIWILWPNFSLASIVFYHALLLLFGVVTLQGSPVSGFTNHQILSVLLEGVGYSGSLR